jgi:hypothetical protein
MNRLCDPEEGCFEGSSKMKCDDSVRGHEFSSQFRCRVPDCIEMKALTLGIEDCNLIFPKVVQTSMEREKGYETDFQRQLWERQQEGKGELSPGILGWLWPGKKPTAIEAGPGKGPDQEWRGAPEKSPAEGSMTSLPLT